jgi:Protein of unknown function (DUF3099)
VRRNRASRNAIVITDAERSYQEEFEVRRRRYARLMALRIPCLVVAALLYQIPWLAVAVILASVPLPWMAVLIANDRLPRKASTFRPHRERETDRVAPAQIPHDRPVRADLAPERPGHAPPTQLEGGRR